MNWNHWKLDEIKPDGGPAMTVDGTAAKLFLMLVLFSAAFLFGWHHFHVLSLNETPQARASTLMTELPAWQGYLLYTEFRFPLYAWLIFFVCFGGSFLTKKGLILRAPMCAVAEGISCGSFEYVLQGPYSGITMICGLAVIGIFITLFAVYRLSLLRIDNPFLLGIAGAVGGLAFLYGVTAILKSFAIEVPFLHEAPAKWSGLFVALIAIVCGTVVITFSEIQAAVDAGAPKWVEWRAAICLFASFVILLKFVRRLLLRRSTGRIILDALSSALSKSAR